VEDEIHEHLRRRLEQRGVTVEEVARVLEEGWSTSDSKPGTEGRVFVFAFDAEWEGRSYNEKEVTVYYKILAGKRILLTARARYGAGFPRE